MLEETKKYIRIYIVRIKVNYLFNFSNQRLLGSMVGKTLGDVAKPQFLLKSVKKDIMEIKNIIVLVSKLNFIF
jgi:hypothetical protein